MLSEETTENLTTQQSYAPTDPPLYYTYAPPPNGTHGEIGSQPGHQPYVMAYALPPGMVHAYPPPGQGVLGLAHVI